MPCTGFEDLLARYAELSEGERQCADAHLLTCQACRNWFEALAEIDSALAAEFESTYAPATLALAVKQGLARPLPARVSAVPEVLDFVGGLGGICAAGLLAYFFFPPSPMLSANVLLALTGILLGFTFSVTLWALNSNES